MMNSAGMVHNTDDLTNIPDTVLEITECSCLEEKDARNYRDNKCHGVFKLGNPNTNIENVDDNLYYYGDTSKYYRETSKLDKSHSGDDSANLFYTYADIENTDTDISIQEGRKINNHSHEKNSKTSISDKHIRNDDISIYFITDNVAQNGTNQNIICRGQNKDDNEPPPSYKYLIGYILKDPPPSYESVTGVQINFEEVRHTIILLKFS